MNVFDLINSVDEKSQETLLEKANRRDAFRHLGEWGKKIALAAIPFGAATAASSTKAFAAGDSITDVLNFALLLEYLEAEYYLTGMDTIVPKGTDAEKIYAQITKHEVAHVELLKSAIGSLGGMPIEKPEFDFTVGGAFMPFSDYTQFLILSQAFEDTGVRAYKGQAANLISNGDVLTVALQIHSVEARHASRVRQLRGDYPYITFSNRGTGMPYATQPVYAGEDVTMQAGVDLKKITTVGRDGITAAYDEPLTKAEVTAIAGLFLKK